MAPKKMKVNEVVTQLQSEHSYDFADDIIRVGGGCQAVPTEVDDYERYVGLKIPVTWFHDDAKTSIEAFKYKFDIEKKKNTLDELRLTWFHDDAKTSIEAFKYKFDIEKKNTLDELRCEVVDSTTKETNRGWEDKGLLPIPESFGESLTNAKHKSFVLGLYMFINNFYLVNEFMRNIGI
nr:hypothetical protein [Tanacetum cinerariifolium]